MIKNIFIMLTLIIIVGCKDDSKPQKTNISTEDNRSQKNSTISFTSIAKDVTDNITKELTGEDNIIVYNAYGNSQTIVVRGRAQKKEKASKVTKDEGALTTFWNQINFFSNDELKNQPIIAIIDNKEYKTQTDDEGYFKFDIAVDNVLKMGYKEIGLHLQNNPNIHKTSVAIITPELQEEKILGIISDIDDTVLVSDVTNKSLVLLNTFWKNFTQREVIEKTKEKINELLAQNPSNVPTPLFFVSGSPRQLAIPIESFLTYNNFPKHNIFLKEIGLLNLLDQKEYKIDEITAIIERYPDMEWVFFGDSGESDKEIYGEIKDDFSSQVKGFYIRDVKTKELKFFKNTTFFDSLLNLLN